MLQQNLCGDLGAEAAQESYTWLLGVRDNDLSRDLENARAMATSDGRALLVGFFVWCGGIELYSK